MTVPDSGGAANAPKHTGHLPSRELRIAPVMTGGTSLAVWMAGATCELYRMVRSADEPTPDAAEPTPAEQGQAIYRKLLDLIETRAVVDVVTGTSAGGLNGTLLAAGTHLGVSTRAFMTIRETWLRVADIEQLLRKPSEANPPAMLKGDDYFAVKVREKLREWADSFKHNDDGEDEGVDLVTTVTTIVPDPLSRSDHFGEQLNEVKHAHRLRFTKKHFEKPDWIEKLAIAARTSASIPGVFEPSYLPVGSDTARLSGRPDFADHATFRSSRWAVDGGVVVNLPLSEALERIFHRTATDEVRRVVLYVSPTPSLARESDAEQLKDEPTMLDSLKTVVLAPRAEGVAEDIDELDEHNRRVRRQAEARRASSLLLEQLELFEAPNMFTIELLEAYKRARAETSVARMLRLLESAPVRRRQRELEAELQLERADLIVDGWDVAKDGAIWSWGIAPVEQAVSQALSILSRTLTLPSPPGVDDVACATWRAKVAAVKKVVHDIRKRVATVRRADTAFWEARVRDRAQQDDAAFETAELKQWASESYTAWPEPAMARDEALEVLKKEHEAVADALVGAIDAICGLTAAATAPGEPTAVSVERKAVRDEFEALLAKGQHAVGRLDPAAGLDEQTRARKLGVQRAFLAVHVAQTVFVGDVLNNEQSIELMQVSFNSWNGLDEERKPQDKLAGPELGRLGAFVKPSWRANDWLWGRMDGAFRLVLLLLEPARLRRLGHVPELKAWLETEAQGSDLPKPLPGPVLTELEELEDASETPPAAMPSTARFLARILQQRIAQEDLPMVVESIQASERVGGNEAESRIFQRAVEREISQHGGTIRAEATSALVQQMRIGQETVRTEFGFGLMNRVSTGLASVLINALTGTRSGIPFVSRLLRPTRAPLQAAASLIRVMTRDSKLAQALSAAVLAIAGAVVALRVAGQDVPPGTFVISAVLLTFVLVGAMARSGFIWLTIVFGLIAATIGLAVIGDDLREVITDKAAPARVGSIDEGAILAFDEGGQVRLQTEDGQVVDLEIAEGSSVTLRSGGAGLVSATRKEKEDDWKRWGFTNHVSIARVLFAAGAFAGLVVLATEWGRITRGTRLSRIGWIGLTVAAACAVRSAGIHLLTSTHGRAGLEKHKEWLINRADELHGVRLELLLVLLVAVGVALSLGADLASTRAARTARRRIIEEFWGGSESLDIVVNNEASS